MGQRKKMLCLNVRHEHLTLTTSLLLDFFKDDSVKYWLSKGAPAEKIIMGIPAYGRTFTLSSSQTGRNAPASGPGTAGPYTKEAGFWSYYEVSRLHTLSIQNKYCRFRLLAWINLFYRIIYVPCTSLLTLIVPSSRECHRTKPGNNLWEPGCAHQKEDASMEF